MQIHELTALARNSKASDIHISEGLPLMSGFFSSDRTIKQYNDEIWHLEA